MPSRLFTVFDVFHHVRELAAPAAFTTQQMARLAFALTPEISQPAGFRVLRNCVDGFYRPQLVIWGSEHELHKTLPVCHSDAPKGICTLAVDPTISRMQLLIEAQRHCNLPSNDVPSLLKGSSSLFLDSEDADPYRPCSLLQVDHASLHRGSDAPTSAVYGATPAGSRSLPLPVPHTTAAPAVTSAVWMTEPVAPADEHGIATVYADHAPVDEGDLQELIVHSFGSGPCRFGFRPYVLPSALPGLWLNVSAQGSLPSSGRVTLHAYLGSRYTSWCCLMPHLWDSALRWLTHDACTPYTELAFGLYFCLLR